MQHLHSACYSSLRIQTNLFFTPTLRVKYYYYFIFILQTRKLKRKEVAYSGKSQNPGKSSKSQNPGNLV